VNVPRKQARELRKQIRDEAIGMLDALYSTHREDLAGMRKWQQNIVLALKLGDRFDAMLTLPEPFESFDNFVLAIFVGLPLVWAWRRKGGAK